MVDKFGEVHDKKPSKKQGNGSPYSRSVLMMVESTATRQEKPNNVNRIMGYAKMIVIDKVNLDSINYEVPNHVDPQSHLITDNNSSYSGLKNLVASHTAHTVKGGKNAKNVKDPV